jgi:hypothetical protein
MKQEAREVIVTEWSPTEKDYLKTVANYTPNLKPEEIEVAFKKNFPNTKHTKQAIYHKFNYFTPPKKECFWTEEKVEELKRRYNKGHALKRIANHFKVSYYSITSQLNKLRFIGQLEPTGRKVEEYTRTINNTPDVVQGIFDFDKVNKSPVEDPIKKVVAANKLAANIQAIDSSVDSLIESKRRTATEIRVGYAQQQSSLDSMKLSVINNITQVLASALQLLK